MSPLTHYHQWVEVHLLGSRVTWRYTLYDEYRNKGSMCPLPASCLHRVKLRFFSVSLAMHVTSPDILWIHSSIGQLLQLNCTTMCKYNACMNKWRHQTHCHMLLHSSCDCEVPPLPLTHPLPKCSRWCLSPVQSGWWMYHWFPSPPRPLLVGCSPPLVEWSTWQCRSQLPQQEPATLLSELEKCFAHQEWHGHPPPCWVDQHCSFC